MDEIADKLRHHLLFRFVDSTVRDPELHFPGRVNGKWTISTFVLEVSIQSMSTGLTVFVENLLPLRMLFSAWNRSDLTFTFVFGGLIRGVLGEDQISCRVA